MKTSIYHDIALRTDSNIYIGVVGPVRTGKSTFVKKFMETLVIPNIENIYHKERAKDELPQSGSGKTIMTAEPKFVPEEAVPITLDGDVNLSVRMIDCVGYMINGASGRFENGEERMVSTPWFDYEVTMTQAAEMGTKKVISDHSTIGLVITTDGSVCGIDRSEYLDAENRVIKELQAIGKPFIILINSTSPEGDYAQSIKAELEEKYHVTSMCVNCLDLNEIQITEILKKILMEFPIVHLGYDLPEWVTSLPRNNTLLDTILNTIYNISSDIKEIKHIYNSLSILNDSPIISQAMISKLDTGSGTAVFNIELPKTLYYETISTQSGFTIENDSQLLNLLTELKDVKTDYDRISDALKSVRETGYGIVTPSTDDLTLQEPEIVKQGGKYSVKLKANAPAIHFIMTNIETTVSPTIGGENASDEIINFLLQSFDGNPSRIWESNIFGKSLYDIARDGVNTKIAGMSKNARSKFQETLQRVVNEGAGGLLCIIL